MHLARTDLFRARWTDRIHDEWIRSLMEKRPDLSRARLERTRDRMNLTVRDSLIADYEPLIDTLVLPDPEDRHVLAAAIRGNADLIVTFNLNDFPAQVLGTYGIEAQHPDDFVCRLLDRSPNEVYAAAKQQREALKNPPKTPAEFLETLEAQRLPNTVIRLRAVIDLL